MPYRHIVLFRFRDGVDEEQIAAAIEALASLKVVPGLIEWTVRRSQDGRKGAVIVENALFENRQALADFAVHPLHLKSAALLSEIADWWIGDYEVPDIEKSSSQSSE